MAERTKKKRGLAGSTYQKAEASPGFLFWKAFNTWNRQLRVALDSLGLTQAQYSILAAIGYLGSSAALVSQQDVSKQLSMDKMMVSDVAKTLEKKGWLKREPHPNDGRAIVLGLTSNGEKRLKEAVPLVEGIDEKFFGRLKKEDKRILCEYLALLVRI